jgi:coenzyme F420-reducing hydrogenase gamma subunit
MRPKVAVFSFTCCEGCGLAILECENELLDLLAAVDIVTWREAMTERTTDYDIAFVEGSISTHADVKRIKEIRENAGMLIAIGSCAHTGGLNAMKNSYGMNEVKEIVYGQDGAHFDTIPARPLSAVVDVDFALPGCPIDKGEFLRAVKDLLRGNTPSIPSYPVCVECKLKGNVCVFDKGMFCMGPITRAGCDAACPSRGAACIGCRGWVDEPNKNAHEETLEKYGLTPDDVMRHFTIFNNYAEEQAAHGA